MRIALKTIVGFLLAAIAPIVMFFAIVFIVALVAPRNLEPSSYAGKVGLGQLFLQGGITVFWTIFLGLLVSGMIFAITSGHVIVLGIPAFLIGLRLKAIRLWSILVVSFLIGAIPAAIYIVAGEWFDAIRYPGYYPPTDFSSAVGMSILAMVFIGMLGGLFGMSGGLAFWLVWRFFIQPDLRLQSEPA